MWVVTTCVVIYCKRLTHVCACVYVCMLFSICKIYNIFSCLYLFNVLSNGLLWHAHTHVYSHLSFLIITHTSTPLLSFPSFPLHVLHGGVCVGLWKQLGLIIDVLHFNQFHHSVRLIKVSFILPGAVCECVKERECVRDAMCVFSCSWGLHAPFYISEYMGILYFRNRRWEIVSLSLSLSLSFYFSRFLMPSLSFLFPTFSSSFSLLLPPSFSLLLSCSVPPPSLSPGRILNAINTTALLPANY